MTSIEFIVIGLTISKSVDWIVQSQWQALNKTKDFDVLFSHSLVYAFLTSFLTMIIIYSNEMFIWFVVTLAITVVLFISHLLIDNRYIVKLIMRAKGVTWEQINSPEYGWMQIGIDQRLHELVILGIGLIMR